MTFPQPLDEARRRRELERGQQASQLLEHPLIKEAFATIEESLFAGWLESRPEERDKREQLYAEMRGLVRAKAHLHEVMTTGKLAAETIHAS